MYVDVATWFSLLLESPPRLCSRARMLTLFLRMSLLLAVSRVTRPDSVAASRSLGQSSADKYIYD